MSTSTIPPDLQDLFSKARLLLMQNQYRFYGIKLLTCDIDFIDIPPVYDDNGNLIEVLNAFTLSPKYTNKKWTIIYNKASLRLPDYTANNLAWLCCHELTHLIYHHSDRKQEFEISFLADIAVEHVTDLFLKVNVPILQPYKNMYNIIQQAVTALGLNPTVGQVYDWLLDKYKKSLINKKEIIAQDEHGNNIKLPLSVATIMDEETNKPIATIIVEDHSQIDDGDAETFKNEARALIEILTQNQPPGRTTSNLLLKLKDILKVDIPPEKLLEKAIRRSIIKVSESKSWIRPNKRLMQYNIILPSNKQSDVEITDKLLVTFDTSASMSKDVIAKGCGVIRDCFNLFRGVYLIVHDVDIKQEIEFTNSQEFYDFITQTGLKGRGGTSHLKVLDRIHDILRECEEEFSLIISITDGYSDLTHYSNKVYSLPIPLVFISDANDYNSMCFTVLATAQPDKISFITFS